MKVVAHIKLDPAVKTAAQRLSGELGFSLSTLINAQLKQFVRDRRLIFSKKANEAAVLDRLLAIIEEDIKKEKNVSKKITTRKELKQFLKGV